MILTTDKMVFVTDFENSDEYIENLITEYGTNQYRIKVDRTLNPPYYQLFYEWKEGKRTLNNHLFSSSRLEKIVDYINQNIQWRMNKEEFLSKRNAIDLKLKELNGKKEQLEKEYIESNQGFPVGSKVCITVSAHERFSLLDNERILVPEVKKLAYIADYEIDDDGEVVPSLRQLDYNGGMSAIPLYVNFKKTIIELV